MTGFASEFYGEDLAYTHDAGHRQEGEAGARLALDLLEPGSRVVELGCGSGASAAVLAGAGHAVTGYDVAPAMVGIARARVPGADFLVGSFTDRTALPACDAVLAISEVLNYTAGGEPDLPVVFARAHAALPPGGLFLLDLLGPDVRRPERWFGEGDGWCVGVEAAVEGDRLVRRIVTFRALDSLWRRSEEIHVQVLVAPEDVLRTLRATGFTARVRRSYPGRPERSGHRVYIARKAP